MKTCTKCRQAKSPERFAVDRSKRDGRDSWCRECRNQARRDSYHAKIEHERRRSREYYGNVVRSDPVRMAERLDRTRQYYQDNRDAILAKERARHRLRAGRSYDPAKERIKYMKRHGGIGEWARLYQAQNGCCYLCGETLEGVPQKMIAVDHDHDCCESGKDTKSCSACRRGLAHAWCNQLIGLAGEDMDVLRAIIANFERVNAETKARIAARSYMQDTLDLGIAI